MSNVFSDLSTRQKAIVACALNISANQYEAAHKATGNRGADRLADETRLLLADLLDEANKTSLSGVDFLLELNFIHSTLESKS